MPFSHPDLRTLVTPEACARYSHAERGSPGHTPGVLLPSSEAAVGAVLAQAQAQGIPLVLSAGRTGLVEAQVPRGEWVLSLEKLTALPAPQGQHITVGAGLAVDTLNAALAAHGLFWPMEMGSTASASVGACIANGSAGANALCYGTAMHLCERAQGFWANGAASPSQPGPVWQAPNPAVTAIDSAAPNPALGLLGTQGSLGVITQATLRLHPLPVQREAAFIPAASMVEAMHILAAARRCFGDDVEEFEFIGAAALAQLAELRGAAHRMPYSVQAPYHLLLQVKHHDANHDLAGALYQFLSHTLALPEAELGYAPIAALKHIRHSLTEASNHAARLRNGGRLAFDTATPLSRFGDYLDALTARLAHSHPSLRVVAFGHAGVGGAHLHLLGTEHTPVAPIAAEVVDAVFNITADYGGTFSAEHGVGSKWGAQWQQRAAPGLRQAFAAAKALHDPAGILAPRNFGFAA